jgi:hypothetical protein
VVLWLKVGLLAFGMRQVKADIAYNLLLSESTWAWVVVLLKVQRA